MSAFSEWRSVGREWGHPDKAGGCKFFLFSPKLVWQMWSTLSQDHKLINNERPWALVHNNGVKFAVCSVYMAVEVLSNNDLSSWNDTIYSHLQFELARLEDEGYKCIIIIGDMNAHIGTPTESRFGITGNKKGLTLTGESLLISLMPMIWSSLIKRTSAQALSHR